MDDVVVPTVPCCHLPPPPALSFSKFPIVWEEQYAQFFIVVTAVAESCELVGERTVAVMAIIFMWIDLLASGFQIRVERFNLTRC